MEGARNFDAPQSLQIEQNSSQISNSPASQDPIPQFIQSDHSDSYDNSNRMTETAQTLLTTPQKPIPENYAPSMPEDDSPARRVSFVPKNNFTLKIPSFNLPGQLKEERESKQEEVKRKKKKLFFSEYVPSSRDLAKFRPHKIRVVVPRASNQKYEKYIPPTVVKESQVIEQKPAKKPLITDLVQDLKLKRQKQLEIQLNHEIRAQMIETPPQSDQEFGDRSAAVRSLAEDQNGLVLNSQVSEGKSEVSMEVSDSEREAAIPGETSNSLQSKPTSDWQRTSTLEIQTSLLQHRYFSQSSNSQGSSNLFKTPTLAKNKRKLKKVEEEQNYEVEENIPENEYGRLNYGDIPKKVLTMYRRDQEVMLMVEWERRPLDGFKPHISEVLSDEFKYDFPLKLIEFYESQTRFETKVLTGRSAKAPMYAMRSRT